MNYFNKIQISIALLLLVLISGCRKPEEETTAPHETGTVTDIDGNVYNTIKIGSQWWMAENLKVTKYRNGTFIPNITSDSLAWTTTTNGAWCSYENSPNNPAIYGLLYNWYAINDTNKIAPAGWHIPSDDEWKQLEATLGMSSNESNTTGWRGSNQGDKLKIAAPNGWTKYQDLWATNESGFTAIGASCRLYNNKFGDPGLFATGFWWTSSTAPDNSAWYRYLDYKNTNVFRAHDDKNYGFSIRCVKD